jgi:MFS family permease
MDQPGATQTSFSNSPTPLQPIGVAGCLRYGLLVGLVFGIASGTTLAIRRIPDFPDDILERCLARGFFGGAGLGILFGLVVGGLIGVLGRRSQRFQVPGATAGAVIGMLTGVVVAALLLMELRTLKTSWRERAPYSDSATTTVAVYSLMSVVGALTGAVFGYALASVIRHRQTFPRNVYVGIPLVAASGFLCGLCVILAAFFLKYLDPVIARCHNFL